MKLVRKITTRILVLFLLLLTFVLSLDAYLEIGGLPPPWRAKLFAVLADKGVTVDAEEVYFGLFNGLVLDNVRIMDGEIPGMTLAAIPRLEIQFDRWQLLQGDLEPLDVRVVNGAVYLPLDDPTMSQSSIMAQPLNVRIRLMPGEYRVDRFSAVVDGIAFTGRGRIGRKPKNASGERQPLSIKPLMAAMGPDVLNALTKFREFTSTALPNAEATLDVDFDLPTNGDPTATFNTSFSHYLYRGLAVEQLALSGRYMPGQLEISQLRLDFDTQEYVQGNFSLDLKARTIQGQLSALCYPHKLLKAFAPKVLDQPFLPRFDGPPPYLKVNILPSPIDRPLEGRVSARLDARTVRLNDGTIDSISLNASYGDQQLTVAACDFVVAPNSSGSISGFIRFDTEECYLHVIVDGDPRPFADLRGDPEFSENYLGIWKEFAWTAGARPHLDLDVYRRSVEGTMRTVVTGAAAMKNFSFDGVPVQSASGDIEVDLLAKELLLTNVQVQQDDREAICNLNYHYERGRKWIDVDIASSLAPKQLLGLVDRDWQELPAQWEVEFLEAPHLRLKGHVAIRGDPAEVGTTDLRGRLLVPLLKRRDLTVRGGALNFHYRDKKLTGSATVQSMGEGDWHIDELDAVEASYVDDTLTVKGKAASVMVEGNEFLYVDATYVRKGRENSANIKALAFIMEGKSDPGIGWDVSSPDLQWSGGGFTAHFNAATFEANGVYGMSQLQSTLELKDHKLYAKGSFVDGWHDSTNARIPAATFDAVHENRDIIATVNTEGLKAFDGMEWTGVVAKVHYDGTTYESDVTGKTFKYKDQYAATDVNGHISVDRNTVRFDSRSATLDAAFARMQQAHVIGVIDHGSWIIDTESEHLQMLGYPFEKASGKVLYEGDRLWVHNFKGRMYDGDVEGFMTMNTTTDIGRILILAHQVQVDPLMNRVEPTTNVTVTALTATTPDGTIPVAVDNATTSADLSAADTPSAVGSKVAVSNTGARMNWQSDLAFEYKGEELMLYGDGTVLLNNGELWRVPVISEFLGFITSTLSITRLVLPKDSGKVSEMIAHFSFDGDRVHVSEMHSNGSVMTIRGQGYYWWKTTGMDFRVEAKMLEGLIKIPFNPLDSILEMRLTGSARERRWEKGTKFLDWFRETKDPRDPTLGPAPSQSRSSTPRASSSRGGGTP